MTKEMEKQLADIKAKISKALEKPLFLADNTESTKRAFVEEVERIFPNSEVEFVTCEKGKLKGKLKVKVNHPK